MVEENVVDVEAAEGVKAGAHHAPALIPDPAAHPEVGPAAAHRKLEAEQRHHAPGHIPGRNQQRQPEEGAAAEIKAVGVEEPAAQVGGPAEGAARLDKLVGVGVKGNLLVVEIPRIVEEPAIEPVNDAVGQEQRGGKGQAEKKHLPVPAFGFLKRRLPHGAFPLF